MCPKLFIAVRNMGVGICGGTVGTNIFVIGGHTKWHVTDRADIAYDGRVGSSMQRTVIRTSTYMGRLNIARTTPHTGLR